MNRIKILIKKVLPKKYYNSVSYWYHFFPSLIFGREKNKLRNELRFWKNRKIKNKNLSNTHYKYLYTTHFGFNENFYTKKSY